MLGGTWKGVGRTHYMVSMAAYLAAGGELGILARGGMRYRSICGQAVHWNDIPAGTPDDAGSRCQNCVRAIARASA